ncbi:c-type cytochrome [Tropicimonas isoalkanivorans]|nr:c-type cytochrome [Tropicimonas isoalkanivorans]
MRCFILAAGAMLALSTGVALAQEAEAKLGEQEYMIACAGCHGEDGKGSGPMAELLVINPPDLTKITERTGGGAFPYYNTMILIDGRNDIRAHGGPMPIWGDRFMSDMRAHDAAWVTPESVKLAVKGRILALTQYLASIQQ